jgi:GNAT superfamily N-acetyltransferase
MTKQQYQAAYGHPEEQQNPCSAFRKVAERQITDGVLRGYMAYVDGKSIGWCNANDRANYPAEPYNDDVPFHAPAETKEKTVVCFEIAPNYRGKGVATTLLQRVIDDARAEVFSAVEGFPVLRDVRYKWDYSGPMRLAICKRRRLLGG